MGDWYFDRYGQAAFTVVDGDRVVSRNGRNLGWLRDKEVYTLVGRPIGWLENGVLRETSGFVVAYTREAASRLPSIPGMSGEPGSVPSAGRPAKPGFAGSVSRPPTAGWGTKTIRDFFGTDV